MAYKTRIAALGWMVAAGPAMFIYVVWIWDSGIDGLPSILPSMLMGCAVSMLVGYAAIRSDVPFGLKVLSAIAVSCMNWFFANLVIASAGLI